MLDRFDMRCFHFGTAAAIDEFEAGDGAATIVGIEHDATEDAVADQAGAVIGDTIAGGVDEGRQFLTQQIGETLDRCALAREKWCLIGNTEIEDTVEVFDRDRADCGPDAQRSRCWSLCRWRRTARTCRSTRSRP